MEIKPEDELSNIVLFPIKRMTLVIRLIFFISHRKDHIAITPLYGLTKERQVRCKICGAVVEPFDWMLSVAKRETRLADDVRLLRQEEQERREI